MSNPEVEPGHTAASPGSPLRWTTAIGAGLALRLRGRVRRLSDEPWWNAHTRRVQEEQLRRLLRRAAATRIGREAGFAKIAELGPGRMVEAYRGSLPMAEYEPYRARLALMREGAEPDVLWPGVVMDWAETSGTTGSGVGGGGGGGGGEGQKYIPVSREMMRSNYRAAMDIFAHAMRFGVSLPRLLGGRLLFLGGSTDVAVSNRGVRTGDLSGLVTPLIRWPLSEVYAPGREVALLSHWPSKIEAMAEACAGQDIRMVSGMASWALVLFERIVRRARERRQIGGGGACVGGLRDIWPNLRLFVHGGVKYDPFEPRIREIWSGEEGVDIPTRLEVYPASEGFIAMQDRRGEPGLRLGTDIGIFYEFVPLEEIGRPDARSFCCDEVEIGQRYVVVMSTCAGLWRYVIGDVVEFDTIPRGERAGVAGVGGVGGGGAARLRIVGRHRHFVNAFGENLIVEDIERAVVAAMRATGARVGEFTAAPIYPGEGRRAGLELAIEWGEAGSTIDFAREFDAELRRSNVDYDTKRTGDLGMAPAVVTRVAMGAFHGWMESRGKLGGQHKAPRCANHREILAGVVAQAGAANQRG